MARLTFTHANGIFKVERNGQVLGQGKNLETLIENASPDSFEASMKFDAAEVLLSLFGPLEEGGNTQILTR
jgi:hypothetical protein